MSRIRRCLPVLGNVLHSMSANCRRASPRPSMASNGLGSACSRVNAGLSPWRMVRRGNRPSSLSASRGYTADTVSIPTRAAILQAAYSKSLSSSSSSSNRRSTVSGIPSPSVSRRTQPVSNNCSKPPVTAVSSAVTGFDSTNDMGGKISLPL